MQMEYVSMYLPPSVSALTMATLSQLQVFMDTLNTPTVKKKLKKLSAQDPGKLLVVRVLCV